MTSSQGQLSLRFFHFGVIRVKPDQLSRHRLVLQQALNGQLLLTPVVDQVLLDSGLPTGSHRYHVPGLLLPLDQSGQLSVAQGHQILVLVRAENLARGAEGHHVDVFGAGGLRCSLSFSLLLGV